MLYVAILQYVYISATVPQATKGVPELSTQSSFHSTILILISIPIAIPIPIAILPAHVFLIAAFKSQMLSYLRGFAALSVPYVS